MAGGYAISITAVDTASKAFDGINKRIAALNAPAERFNKAMARFGDTTGLSRVSEGVRGLGAGAADAFRSLDRMASPLASITSVGSLAGMAALTRRWAEFGNQIGQTAYRLNTPVEKLGALRGAMRLAGGSAADLDTGIGALDEKLRGAAFGRDTGAIQLFRSLNIGFGDAEHGARTAADALGDVADAIQKAKDPRDQQYIADQFGVGGMLPLLKNGRKGLEDFQKQAEKTGGVMTGQMVQNATEMNKAWQRLGLDFEGVGNRMVERWSGTVTGILENSSRWIEGNKKTADSIASIASGIGLLAAIKPAQWILKLLGLPILAEGLPLAAPMLAAGAYNGSKNLPMVDENGNLVGNWGGADNPPMPDGKTPTGNPIWNALSKLWGGRAPPPITAPSGPTNSAAAMRRMHDYFRGKGLDEQQTAGILSNAAAESGFDASKSGDGGTSYGLFQTHADRLAKMQQRYGTSTPNEQQQLDFAWDELNTSKKSTLDRIRGVHTSGQSGAIFSEGFEVPQGGQGEAFRRGQAAPQFEMQDAAPGKLTPDGSVHVEVTLKGATAGTTAKSTASGSATTAPPRIETPMPLVN